LGSEDVTMLRGGRLYWEITAGFRQQIFEEVFPPLCLVDFVQVDTPASRFVSFFYVIYLDRIRCRFNYTIYEQVHIVVAA